MIVKSYADISSYHYHLSHVVYSLLLTTLANSSDPVKTDILWIKETKIAIRRDGKSLNLKVNDKHLQTANLVYIFDEKHVILSVTTNKYGMKTITLSSQNFHL